MRTDEQEEMRTGRQDRNKGGHEYRKTGVENDRSALGKEDMRTGGEEERMTWEHVDRRTGFSFGSAIFCKVSFLPNCYLPMSVYKYTSVMSVINLQLIFVSVYKYPAP